MFLQKELITGSSGSFLQFGDGSSENTLAMLMLENGLGARSSQTLPCSKS
jgi:hypothetical protein